MASSEVRYACPEATTEEVWRSSPYKAWTTGRLCFRFVSHSVMATRYLLHFLNGRATVHVPKSQLNLMKGAVVLNGHIVQSLLPVTDQAVDVTL